MGISKGSAQWNGGLKDGKGVMKPAHAPEAPFWLGTRFEGQPGSNPEELIGAALSGCSPWPCPWGSRRRASSPPSIKTSADVNLEKQGAGFAITAIVLTCEANVPGASADLFQKIAEETKKNCPVSKALAGVNITLKASLAR